MQLRASLAFGKVVATALMRGLDQVADELGIAKLAQGSA
jgi:hypothetical protein